MVYIRFCNEIFGKLSRISLLIFCVSYMSGRFYDENGVKNKEAYLL